MKELKKQASMLKLLGGEIYLQQYEEKKELGRGKFGVVFQVQDKNSKRIYAAKHIKTRKKEQREKVVEEIAILKKFSNPHIIRFINAFETPSEVILVMEYLDGGELFERVAADDFNLTESDCCLFMRQICRGVQYLHDHHIVHLDLKPENVVCTERENATVKIIDFGTAMELEPGEQIKSLVGTPEFVAPEVVNYDFICTGTDMWSLGVICYILLSGYSPFMGDNDTETYNNISNVQFDFDLEEFDSISENAQDFISCLLKKSPRTRLDASQCLEHSWLMEKDLSQRVIKTEKLKAFLARRRWQRCGQAIRALSRLRTLSNSSSTESLNNLSTEASPSTSVAASPLASPLASPASSQVSSPVLGRRAAPLAEALVTSARLNLLEEKLKQELSAGRLIMKSQGESEKIFKSHVESEPSSSESKDTR